jgi:type I restriction enzyme S subunit
MNALPKRAHVFWWKDLERWIVPALQHSTKLPEGWSLVRIGDVVKQVTDKVKVEPDNEYKLAGVRWYGEGVFHRETVIGSNSSATYLMPLIPGSFIYNRLFAWKESFAVVPEELNGCLVSNEFPQFQIDLERLLVRYLYLFFMCKSTIRAVNKASIGSAAVSRNRYKEEYFLNVQIPLPPLPVQRAIVDRWQRIRSTIKDGEHRIEEHENNLVTAVLLDAGIKSNTTQKRSKAVGLHFKDLERWGVEFNRHQWRLDNLLLSTKYITKRLSEIAQINPSGAETLPGDTAVTFVPMESVSGISGEIESAQIKTYREACKGYTRFRDNDIIWAKITPCMQNGKSAVAKNLINGVGFGSTEFHVIRTTNSINIRPEYLWILLRLEVVKSAAQRYFVGSAGQQRVPVEFLEDLHVPIPPIEVQDEIIKQVIAKRKEIAKEKAEIHNFSDAIGNEIEAMILGTKKIDLPFVPENSI